MDPVDPAALAAARAVLDGARRVAVLTGAGISTDSGIPDFRGPNGIWTRDPAAEKRSTIDHYLSDTTVREAAWRIRLESEMWAAEPNAGHHAVADLARQGRLHTLVTQNIDGLHSAAGLSADHVVEVHGTVHAVECLGCGDRGPMGPVLERVRQGEPDPPCAACGGILKSATIMFGQALVPADLARAERAAIEADVLVAVGTSLNVYPVAGMVPLALELGRPVVIVNAEPTPFDDAVTVVVRGSASDVLPLLFAPRSDGGSEMSTN
ncbi:SIR2 family NAD-dependent protein deacylase [Rhabdothermincola salaria]|uniref:SIR2 family NAD-dependent protein deacylase n=1 Tax=Rhabdothermincola salaria TaxID=2903142 RepID=UPI001E45877E|nr:Sir2 family NAD-dependent protein deacetylase [Rhabdothermincola salaria]MCD9623393.1 Sir2 family NAD-dependent protein deacetylase [Rhabdothermincola salaria]